MHDSVVETVPLVTVLMPVHNGERFLAEAIESILSQTFQDFEFLILNDGSTDSSRSIVAGFNDARIRLLDNDHNVGVTRTLNRGIREARGHYLARMDADDLSMPGRLDAQVAHLESHPDCAVVVTFARVIDADSRPIGNARVDLSAGELERELQFHNRIIHGAVMMRTDVVRGLGGYDETMARAQDYDLWLRISDEHAIHTLPEFLYRWRDHDRSISSVHTEEQDRFAAQARDAARRRRIDHVLTRVNHGELPVTEAIRIVSRRMRDEDEFRASRDGRRDWIRRLTELVPALGFVRYEIAERKRLRALRSIVRSCAAGAHDASEARNRLAEIVSGRASSD